MKKIGLRIDVDTYRGTREGVPRLKYMLAKHGVSASFFFSVGPDNMGRNLWRLVRPAFLWKMLRSDAPGLYGWDILLKGTFWPGPLIGRAHADNIREIAEGGHEIGVHAWDHYLWQNFLPTMSQEIFLRQFEQAYQCIEEIAGIPPTCSANPAWRSTPWTLELKEKFPLAYNSDCKGHSLFRPLLPDGSAGTIQIPTTLPVYDEVIGRNGIRDGNYNEFSLSHLRESEINVLTIHAEVEGRICSSLFEDYIARAKKLGYDFVPLSALLEAKNYPQEEMVCANISGRDGLVSMQLPPKNHQS